MIICTPNTFFYIREVSAGLKFVGQKVLLTQISLFDYLQVTVVCLFLQDMTGFHHFLVLLFS